VEGAASGVPFTLFVLLILSFVSSVLIEIDRINRIDADRINRIDKGKEPAQVFLAYPSSC